MMGAGRLQLVTPPPLKVTTKERTQPLSCFPPSHPLWSEQLVSQVLVATHLVTLLTRVPLGSSLSSGTLSPQRTMQQELNLPALRSQGRTRTRTRGPHVHISLTFPYSPPGLGDLGGLQILVGPWYTKEQNQ